MHVHLAGEGPSLLLVHGSATVAAGWGGQIAGLSRYFKILAYDRRGAPQSPLPPGANFWSVEQHAQDAEALIEAHLPGPVLAVGSSFGAVVVLALARRIPTRLAGMVLCEPPLPSSDALPSVPTDYLQQMRRTATESGEEAAAAFFLQTVLGPEVYRAMPPAWRKRSLALHRAIFLDSEALAAHRVDYATLDQVRVPTLLCGGGRSGPYFEPTLEALGRRLPRAERVTFPEAGHMMHVDALSAFNSEVLRFSKSVAGVVG